MARPGDDHDDGLHGDHDAHENVPHDVLHDARHGDFRDDLRQTIL